MAIARLLQTGFEWSTPELDSLFPGNVGGTFVITGNLANSYTGYYYAAIGGLSTDGRYTLPISALTQARASCMFLVASVGSSDAPDILSFHSGGVGTPIARLRYDGDNEQLEALCGATEVATYAINLKDSAWRQIGMDVKIDGAAGWFYVYINGVEVIGFDGDTNDGGANFDTFCIVNSIDNQTFTSARMDDVYWDSTTGEGAPAIPPLYRFFFHIPNGNGNYSDWLGSDGNSVNNYLLVDEVTPATADYVAHDTTTEQDTYTTIFYQEDVPPGATINAVIPMAYARKDDGATTLDLKLMTREDAADDVGAAQTLTVDWEVYWERFPLDPSSGAWTKTTVDAMEIGLYVE